MNEVFKDIPGYEGLYQVSNHGRVKSLERKEFASYRDKLVKERILKSGMDSIGYLNVTLCNGKRKTYSVHQLVAMAFLNHKPCGLKLVVDHKDFDIKNNHLSNLRLKSHRENTNRKHLKGTSKYTGVSWKKDRKNWSAQITINSKVKYLGGFTDELEASRAYEIALKEVI